MDSATNCNSEFSSFNGEHLRELFVEVDRELETDDFDPPCCIVIAGGAMIALRDSARVTGDVDVVSDGMPQSLRQSLRLSLPPVADPAPADVSLSNVAGDGGQPARECRDADTEA